MSRAPLRLVTPTDLHVAEMREEDRRVRRGYAIGFALGLLLWLVVIAFCWLVVGFADLTQRGGAVPPTEPTFSPSYPEPDSLRRGRTPAP